MNEFREALGPGLRRFPRWIRRSTMRCLGWGIWILYCVRGNRRWGHLAKEVSRIKKAQERSQTNYTECLYGKVDLK
jgi:hypothetical protein